MKSEHKDSGKIFYYTEDEVKDLCLRAIQSRLSCTKGTTWIFMKWWNNIKKK